MRTRKKDTKKKFRRTRSGIYSVVGFAGIIGFIGMIGVFSFFLTRLYPEALKLAPPIYAASKTWKGSASDSNCSTASNWSPSGIPASSDDIILDSTSGGRSLTWDSGCPSTIASWTQDTYTGSVTIATTYAGAFQTFTVTNDVVINSGSWLHLDNSSAETNRLRVSVGGNFTLGAKGRINVDNLGFDPLYGPGAGAGNHSAGSYGGIGAVYSGSPTVGPTYGSITEPTNLGSGASSGGQGSGGGAIYIVVTGSTTLNGAISAISTTGCIVGSGGSVYLRTGTLSGNGTISVNSTSNGCPAGGGGGRIAVLLTSGTSFGSVTMTAYGGDGLVAGTDGAAGTIYQEKSTDTANRGELIIDNGNRSDVTSTTITDLSGNASASYQFARLTLLNAGILGIGSDDTLNVTSATLTGDMDDQNEGIKLNGGTLTTDAALSWTGFYIHINSSTSTFNPATSITIGNGAKLTVDDPKTFAGSMRIQFGGTLSHEDNSTAQTNRINITVASLTVDSGGAINVDSLGFDATYGPGAGAGMHAGGSYGGKGGASGTATAGSTYGSITAPEDLGSGASSSGQGSGGGAVKLTVAGATVLNGTMSSVGRNGCVTGAGGSIYLTTGTLSGTGTINASGHTASCGEGAPGGGRIAVILTSGMDFGSVTMKAYGGRNGQAGVSATLDGAAGTIYRKTANQTSGDLIIDNEGRSVNATTELNGQTATEATVGSLTISNAGKFTIGSDDSLTLQGNGRSVLINTSTTLTNSGTLVVSGTGGTNNGTFTNATGSLVRYTGQSDDRDVTILTATYDDLAFNNTGSTFLAAGNITVNDDLTISAGTFDLSGKNLTVSAANTTFSNYGTLKLQGGETVSNLTNDTDTGTVEYSGGGAYGSLVVGNNYYNLSINGAGSFTAAANTDVNGAFTLRTGTFVAPPTLTVAGTLEREGGTFTHSNGTVTLDGGNQTLSGSITFNNLSKTVTSATTLTLDAEDTVTIAGTTTLQGAAGNLLRLRSSREGTQWKIDPQGTRSISYVDVKDSNNINSTTINPTTSTDAGNNTNWFPHIITLTEAQALSGSALQGGSKGPSGERREEIQLIREEESRRIEEISRQEQQIQEIVGGRVVTLKDNGVIILTNRQCLIRNLVQEKTNTLPLSFSFIRLTDLDGRALLPSHVQSDNLQLPATRLQAFELVLRSSCLPILEGGEILTRLQERKELLHAAPPDRSPVISSRFQKRELQSTAPSPLSIPVSVGSERMILQSPFEDVPLNFEEEVFYRSIELPGPIRVFRKEEVFMQRVMLSSYLYGVYLPYGSPEVLANPSAPINRKELRSYLRNALIVHQNLYGELPLPMEAILDRVFPRPPVVPLPKEKTYYYSLEGIPYARPKTLPPDYDTTPLTIGEVFTALYRYAVEGGFVGG